MFQVVSYGPPSIKRTRCAHAGILLKLFPTVPLVWPRASPHMLEVKRAQYGGRRRTVHQTANAVQLKVTTLVPDQDAKYRAPPLGFLF